MTGVRAAVIAGLACVAGAWLFATPPLQTPDEAAHYLRAAAIANGQLIGRRVPLDPIGRATLREGSWHAQEERWIEHDRRGTFVTPAMSPAGAVCANDLPNTGKGCTEVSYTGDYFPTAYALPALAFLGADHWRAALWWMRFASLVPAFGFLAIAVVFASRRGIWSLLGLLAAMTPMVVSLAATLNPSGLEIAAGLAFLTGLLNLGRDVAGFSTRSWVALVAAGVVTVLSWQLGAVFAAVDVLAATALMKPAQRRVLLGPGSAAGRAGVIALATAVGLFIVYGVISGTLHSSLHLTPLGASLKAGRLEFTETLRGAVGIFGPYDIKLPSPMSQLWWAATLALLATALWVGRTRERAVLAAAAVFAVAFPVLFYGFAYRYSGFGLQGRYVLPALTLVPLISGHVIANHTDRLPAAVRLLATTSVVGFAAFQLIAWWVNAHHWATGDSVLLAHAAWRPPLGWLPWLGLACVGCLAIAAAPTLSDSARTPRSQPAHPPA